MTVWLSNSERLTVDKVVFASGYRADLTRVPYLATLLARIDTADGFPILNTSFETSLAGLYVTGAASANSSMGLVQEADGSVDTVTLPSGQKTTVAAVARLVPPTAWETRSCGRGCKGHRDYAWAWAATCAK